MHTNTVPARSQLNASINQLNKSFELSTNMLLQLHKSFVRPILEYGNTVWGPMFVLDQQSVEKIQRRATKLVREIKDSYVDRLRILNLPSLKYRCVRGDLIYTYKLVHNLLDDPASLFTFRSSSSITRGYCFNPLRLKCHYSGFVIMIHYKNYNSCMLWATNLE